VAARTENTLIGFGNIRLPTLGEDEPAIVAGELSPWPLKLKAAPRKADGASYEHFFLNTTPPNLTPRTSPVLKNCKRPGLTRVVARGAFRKGSLVILRALINGRYD
jgi:hypothetical protein